MNNDGSSNSGITNGTQPFFTPGVGNNSPNVNPSTENINTNDVAWQNDGSHDVSKIGQQAIFSPESTMDGPNPESTSTPEIPSTPNQANVAEPATTEMSMPPGYIEPEEPIEKAISENQPTTNVQLGNNERITKKTLDNIEKSTEILSKGDAASYYEAIRGGIIGEEGAQ